MSSTTAAGAPTLPGVTPSPTTAAATPVVARPGRSRRLAAVPVRHRLVGERRWHPDCDRASLAGFFLSLGRLTGITGPACCPPGAPHGPDPFVERSYGQDDLTAKHRLVGFTSFTLRPRPPHAPSPRVCREHHARSRRHLRRPRPQRPGMLLASPHGRADHGRRDVDPEAPPGAAVRVPAPHPPLRLPRRRACGAAPAVDRRGLPPAPPPRSSGGLWG